mmetsp:Transcript_37129/g.98906  ORF Transcript_37129/g.98906 Transcript_37129/m.98906 type:complete len:200 (-) Transcript_37129:231-830(-)
MNSPKWFYVHVHRQVGLCEPCLRAVARRHWPCACQDVRPVPPSINLGSESLGFLSGWRLRGRLQLLLNGAQPLFKTLLLPGVLLLLFVDECLERDALRQERGALRYGRPQLSFQPDRVCEVVLPSTFKVTLALLKPLSQLTATQVQMRHVLSVLVDQSPLALKLIANLPHLGVHDGNCGRDHLLLMHTYRQRIGWSGHG